MGNDVIHQLTTSQDYSLQVRLRDRDGGEVFSHYDHFHVDAEDANYRSPFTYSVFRPTENRAGAGART